VAAITARASSVSAERCVAEGSAMPRSSVHLLAYLGNAAALAAFAFFAFTRNVGNLFVGLDGTYMLTIIQQQFPWMPASLGFSGNPLKGLGDMWYPTNTPLIPGYALPEALFGAAAVGEGRFQALAFAVFAVELFLTTVILGRSLGFER